MKLLRNLKPGTIFSFVEPGYIRNKYLYTTKGIVKLSNHRYWHSGHVEPWSINAYLGGVAVNIWTLRSLELKEGPRKTLNNLQSGDIFRFGNSIRDDESRFFIRTAGEFCIRLQPVTNLHQSYHLYTAKFFYNSQIVNTYTVEAVQWEAQ